MKICRLLRPALALTCLVVASRLSAVPLPFNVPITGELTKPGQKASYTFNGTIGQRLHYDALEADIDPISVRLFGPSGNIVFINGNADSDVGPFTLQETGGYTLEIDGSLYRILGAPVRDATRLVWTAEAREL